MSRRYFIGGSWDYGTRTALVVNRSWLPVARRDSLGFRLVRKR